MRQYTEGKLRKKQRGDGSWVWCAIISYKENGKQKQLTKVLQALDKRGVSRAIKCDSLTDEEKRGRGRAIEPTGTGATTAATALKEWRDSLIAEEQEKELQAQREAEEAARLAALPDEATMTVYEYVDNYLSTKRNARTGEKLAISTKDNYKYSMKLIAHPALNKPVSTLTSKDVESWLATLRRDEGKGEAVLTKAFRLLRQAMKKAAKDDVIAKNPCDYISVEDGKPTIPSKSGKVSTLDMQGIERLNVLLDNIGHTQMADCARCALLTGMREGEICALRWQDIDGWHQGEFNVINVRQAIQRDSTGSYPADVPKNGQWRHFEANTQMRELLSYRYEFMVEQCELAGVEFTGTQYVFGTPSEEAGKGYYSAGYLCKVWRYFADANNVVDIRGERLTFHGLRHSFATNGLMNGIKVEDMAKLLGHSDPSITYRIYFDFIPADKAEQVETMGEIMSARPKKKEDAENGES